MAISTQNKLRALEKHYSDLDESRNQRLDRLASAIGNQLNPPRPFTRQALYNVLRTGQAGRFLARGIERLYIQEIAS